MIKQLGNKVNEIIELNENNIKNEKRQNNLLKIDDEEIKFSNEESKELISYSEGSKNYGTI